jgi:ethanolamine ammonia-lyase large subunit
MFGCPSNKSACSHRALVYEDTLTCQDCGEILEESYLKREDYSTGYVYGEKLQGKMAWGIKNYNLEDSRDYVVKKTVESLASKIEMISDNLQGQCVSLASKLVNSDVTLAKKMTLVAQSTNLRVYAELSLETY